MEPTAMISTPDALTPAVLNKAIGRYYKELQDYASQASHELALRPAFQNLLAEMARKINLTLVHEMTIRGRIRPDGVVCDEFHIQRGYCVVRFALRREKGYKGLWVRNTIHMQVAREDARQRGVSPVL